MVHQDLRPVSTTVEEYYCALSTSYGFKVMVHSPDEIPSVVTQGMAISSGFETDMVITPLITESENSVRRIQRTIRQCLFQNENFRPYSEYSFMWRYWAFHSHWRLS